VLASVGAAAGAGQGAAARGVQYGLQDDAWLVGGPGTLEERVATLAGLGVDGVRVTLHWDRLARARPARPRDPADPAYDWSGVDPVLRELRRQRIAPLVTLLGTPPWANGGRGPAAVPRSRASMRNFAEAAARRYPFVRRWLVWNEPNQRRWLRPTSAEAYVRRLLNPARAGIRAANRRAKVGGGVTAPRGGRGGVSPVRWIRELRAAGARLDAYAHNPYPIRRGETPSAGGCPHCRTIGLADLDRLRREVGAAFPRARIWLTEYGYETRPPDPAGVSLATQARFIGESASRARSAPKVDLLVWFLYRDEPHLDRWQSGLLRSSGRAKPGRTAFMLPIAQRARRASTAVVWAQVRPREGRQPYRLQLRRQGGWRWAGPVRSTDRRGELVRTVRARPGSWVRIWSPRDRRFSVPLRLR
jgi:hypothetical protein